VKRFARTHIEQARKARQYRQADFAVLVTNSFPAEKQHYFVEKSVFVISPIGLEPLTYTLRESLLRIAVLKITNQAKEKAVQKIYDFLASSEYNGKVNNLACQLLQLREDLVSEMAVHKRAWGKRYAIYRELFNDVGAIDHRLKELTCSKPNPRSTPIANIERKEGWPEKFCLEQAEILVPQPQVSSSEGLSRINTNSHEVSL